jgi:hypothetical protein
MRTPSTVAAAGEQLERTSCAETSTGESLPAPTIVPGIEVIAAPASELVGA